MTETPFALSDEEVEERLITGQSEDWLRDYFGPAEYEELAGLARQVRLRARGRGPRVLIVPGFMGSKIGIPRRVFDEVVWLDPIDVLRGKLGRLALPDEGLRAVGVMLFAYLKLKFRLMLRGFDASFFPYDWRLGLDALGRLLNRQLAREEADEVHIVAHSMGGLVTRSALAQQPSGKIGRFVMLGTPNHGSFAPVEALRGTADLAKKLAKIDLRRNVLELSKQVFKTFPSLHQMLPTPEVFDGIDLYQLANWPNSFGPDTRLLRDARRVQRSLAGATARTHLIAGVNQKTVVELSSDANGFVLVSSNEGDGTVPLRCAKLEGAETFYVEEEHGSLANNRTVAKAVADLLERGETLALPGSWDRSRANERLEVSEAEKAARSVLPDVPPESLPTRARRELLEEFVAPTARDRDVASEGAEPTPGVAPAPPGYGHRFENVVVARRRQHPLDLVLARGDIANCDARTLVLGVFQGVEPSGGASAVDRRLDGAIKEFTTRRMFSGQVGETFILPTGRAEIRAESVLLAGLGRFDAFGPEAQQLVAENVARTLVLTQVQDFATVLIGASSGLDIERALFNILNGTFRGLRDAGDGDRLRRITLCEYDEARYQDIKAELYRLASTSLFDDIHVTISEREVPTSAPASTRGGARLSDVQRQAYVIVQREESEHATEDWSYPASYRASILTADSEAPAGSKAAVLSEDWTVWESELDRTIDAVAGARTLASQRSRARRLADLVLGPRIQRGIQELSEFHLVVLHDAHASRIPWETLEFAGRAPATGMGLSRRYVADDLSVAKWLERRRQSTELNVLLVVNPTGDLDGAEDEGARIHQLLAGRPQVRLERIEGKSATHDRLRAELSSGRHDVVHYAGHAEFDEQVPSRSGIVCAGDEVLSGADLAGLSNLPALAIFNACESGRVRVRGQARDRREVRKSHVSFAEAFLRGGIGNFVGTYWPVGDAAAAIFAEALYESILAGKALGPAVVAARQALRTARSPDWSNYIHYGNADFRVKEWTPPMTGTGRGDLRS